MATASKNKAAAPAAADNKAGADAAAAKQTAAKKTVKVPALSVVSSRDGFRRGGRAWSKEATVVKLSALSREQIAQIKGESLLKVTEVEVDEEAASE